MRKVVITGAGAFSALGIEKDEHVQAHRIGQIGVSDIASEEGYFPKRAGVVKDFNPRDFIADRKSVRFMTRQVILGVSSASLALRDAKLDSNLFLSEDPNRNGVIYGAGMVQSVLSAKDVFLKSLNEDGSIDYQELGINGYRGLPPLWILPRLPNTTAGQISIQNSLKGINYSVVNGASSGFVAIGEGFEAIGDGLSDRIVCGGSEWDPMVDYIEKMQRLGIASITSNSGASFHEKSDGLLCSEGAATIVLEDIETARKRDCDIYGFIGGYANFYVPDIKSIGYKDLSMHYQKTMKKAISDAGLTLDQIDMINASGCGVNLIDKAEAHAIKELFGKDVMVTSPMQLLGNTLAASGALNVFYGALQLKEGYVAPINQEGTLHFEDHVSYVTNPIENGDLKTVLCNSFDFMGNAGAIVITKEENV